MDRAPSVEEQHTGAYALVAPARVNPQRRPVAAAGCFLPDLTWFAGRPRAGPRTITATVAGWPRGRRPLGRDFGLARADCEYRAPLIPRLARSAPMLLRGEPREGLRRVALDVVEPDRVHAPGRCSRHTCAIRRHGHGRRGRLEAQLLTDGQWAGVTTHSPPGPTSFVLASTGRRAGARGSPRAGPWPEPLHAADRATMASRARCYPPADRRPSTSPSVRRPPGARRGSDTGAGRRLGLAQTADAAEHGRDPPPRPAHLVLDLRERPRLIGPRGKGVEQLAHQVAAAVVEPLDLAGSPIAFCGACSRIARNATPPVVHREPC